MNTSILTNTDNISPEVLLKKAMQLQEKLSAWRRDFHQHPEIGFEEFRSSEIVYRHLKSLGFELQKGIGKTGLVAVLEGKEPGPTVALRADMDALPIQEDKDGLAYVSQVQGKAHLCGHDAHTSMLMAAAEIIGSLGKPKRGNIKFLFQPAEEGLAGAKAMIDDGALLHPKVDAIFGLHVYPGLASGKIGGIAGPAFASVDFIEITILGKGGHAARPQEGIDAIAVAAQVITALQNVCSRMIDPLEPAVISLGTIEGGDFETSLAAKVKMRGTVRTLSPELRQKMPELIEQVIDGTTRSFKASYEFVYRRAYPILNNDASLLKFVRETNKAFNVGDTWVPLKASTGGEDFAFYSEIVPGAFFRLGVNDGTERTSFPLHHPRFDLDEKALPYGAALLSSLALEFLDHPKKALELISETSSY